MQESVSAVLAMLGYGDSDFQGNLSSAKMSFYKAQKLNKNITKKAKAAMTYADMCCLLYNMLVTADKNGTIYGRTLGYALENVEGRANDGISFSIDSGEMVAIVGKSGSGKSTIIIITHDNSIAMEARRVIQIHDGKLIFDGTAEGYRERVTGK